MLRRIEDRDRVVVRFAGDSGDGMQMVGALFTAANARAGTDLMTLPDFPAEIRVPPGSSHGISSFQVNLTASRAMTAGDSPDLLVAMNPAALRASMDDLVPGATVVVDEDMFTRRGLKKAGFAADPLADDSLRSFVVHAVPISTVTARAVESIDELGPREASRARGLFALGLASRLCDRPIDASERWLHARFGAGTPVARANVAALNAGWAFGETAELGEVRRGVARSDALPPGTYRTVSGSHALALGLVAASVRSRLRLFFAGYPITPASELMQELARHQADGLRVIQAEDEIAAAGMAVGAAFAGGLAATATSGPGFDLMTETIGLAVALELPLVVIDVQRAGPSTGMPTKTEQADLMAAIHGRHGESPAVVLAASSPAQCFEAAFEAASIAIRYRCPVVLLADLQLAQSTAAWRIPAPGDLPEIDPRLAQAADSEDVAGFAPYSRDTSGARPWAVPGTPGLAHRISGLEHTERGAITYDPADHASMTQARAGKLDVMAADFPAPEFEGDEDADLLVVGWGSTRGHILAATRAVRGRGGSVATAHLRHLHPLSPATAALLRRHPSVLCAELNGGQLAALLRAACGVPIESLGKIEGRPFAVAELESAITARLAA